MAEASESKNTLKKSIRKTSSEPPADSVGDIPTLSAPKPFVPGGPHSPGGGIREGSRLDKAAKKNSRFRIEQKAQVCLDQLRGITGYTPSQEILDRFPEASAGPTCYRWKGLRAGNPRWEEFKEAIGDK